ncbi:hypothetical protein [Hymenobacter edaphi]|nr:hypothetical protein [Hymenobacter edaphi]
MSVREDDVEFFRKLRAQNVDKIILANGGISLYRKEAALDYDIKLLIDKD